MKRFLLFSVGILIAFASIKAETYTHTFKKGDLNNLTVDGGSVTFSDIVWTASKANAIAWNDDKGIQIGSAKSSIGACKNYSLTTSAFAEYEIKSITVNTCIASSGDAKLKITAGETTNEYTIDVYNENAAKNSYTLTCDTKGDITISWTASQKAYYLKSITIEYQIPAHLIDVEEPTFKTPSGVYIAKDSVIVETKDQNLVLFYTLDGTTPNHEDFYNGTGTTLCSKYWVAYHVLEKSVNMKVIAVKDSIYKSDVVEAKYIVSPIKPYIPAKEIKSESKYAFVANGKSADFLFGKDTDEALQSRSLNGEYDKYIETIEYNAFTFTTTTGGYTVQDAENRYMYINNGVLSFAKEKPANGAVWSVSINDGKATIKNGDRTLFYSKTNETFGCYSAQTGDLELPAMYMMREYPEYTITPENNSYLEELQKITIKCNEGIKASDNLNIEATDGYNIKKSFTCNLIDQNTLEFTLNEPLRLENSTYLWINMIGEIILCPDEMGQKLPVTVRYGTATIANYTITGYAAAATIETVVPANGSKVEQLSYILFTFSYYAGKTDNTEISPKLYLEGSEDLIPIEFTTENENETGKVEQKQCALKVTNPVRKNGTYVLEVPDGYFVDGNGKDIKGITLKYIVENDGTGINDIIAEGENHWIVYDITGIRVLETSNAESLMTLPKGVYIVNGTKRLIK